MTIRQKLNDAVGRTPYVGEILTTEISAKGLATAALAATIALSPMPAKADGSVEAMAGHKATTIDLKVSGEVAPRTGLFVREITTTDYEGNVSAFGLIDLSYKVIGGLDVVGEVQAAPGMGVIPRIGAQYFGQFGDLAIYALGTVKAGEHPDGEFVTVIGYAPKLAEGVNLLTSLENLTSVGESGHQFSVQRARVGVTLADKYQIGVGADLTEVGNEGTLDANVGGFAGLKF